MMIIREKKYLKNKKKKYLIGALVWLVVMFAVFITGLILNKTRNNVFTVVAAVLTLPVAQYATQLFAILKFKDPDEKISSQLECIQGNYSIIHNALMPDQRGMIYFDHIIVTGQNIYCIVEGDQDISNTKQCFERKISAKGIPIKVVTYVEMTTTKHIEKILKQIEASAQSNNVQELDEYTQLITQMMM